MTRHPPRLRAGAAFLLVSATLAVLGAGIARADAEPPLPPVHHVWVVNLENKNYAETFDAVAGYLGGVLPTQGALLRQYYGTGHVSADNYVAQQAGQAPTAETQSDCQEYTNVTPGTPTLGGQVIGQGCVYPASVGTLAGQVAAAGLTWRGYLEDLGNDPAREETTCGRPLTTGGAVADPAAIPAAQDRTQVATASDSYAARHNPFVYFHSLTDSGACNAQVGGLDRLAGDLASVASTPNYSLITPNLCNDGHDTTCAGTNVAGGKTGGSVAADLWLQKYVPMITSSPAYQQDGMLVVTFDEAEVGTASVPDAGACCGEPSGPNTAAPGITGPGGGRVGAVVLSPYVAPGTVSDVGYNHYSLLRSIEDLLGIGTGGTDGHGHLGYAAQPVGVRQPTTTATAQTAPFVGFGSDVFTAGAAGNALPEVPLPLLLPAAGAAVVVGTATWARRRRSAPTL